MKLRVRLLSKSNVCFTQKPCIKQRINGCVYSQETLLSIVVRNSFIVFTSFTSFLLLLARITQRLFENCFSHANITWYYLLFLLVVLKQIQWLLNTQFYFFFLTLIKFFLFMQNCIVSIISNQKRLKTLINRGTKTALWVTITRGFFQSRQAELILALIFFHLQDLILA